MSKLLAFIAVLCLQAAAHAADRSAIPEPIVIVLRDAASQPGETLTGMRREVTRLLSPAHLAIEWRTGISPGEHFSGLVTLDFRGTCAAEPLRRAGVSAEDVKRLAWAESDDHRILPFATVSCDAVRKVIGAALSASTSDTRALIMGRALGRVVAHELYHIIAKSARHSGGGASKACFGPAELTRANLSFDPLTLAEMRPLQVPVDDALPFTEESGAAR